MPVRSLAVLPLLVLLAGCGGEDNSAAPVETSAPGDHAAAPAPDPVERGRKLFASACAICHTQKEGDHSRVGPNLFGIVGRKAASIDDFAYSNAMRASGIVWSEEELDAYLTNPQAVVRGNRMAYAGEPNAEKRAAIIAYLKTLK